MSWVAVGATAVSVVGGVVSKSMSKSGSSSTQTAQSSNPALENYMKGYNSSAAWGFATLDPTANLEAQANGKLRNLGADFNKNLKNMSDAEKQQATDTKAALDRIKQRQSSGQFLTPQETDYINTNLDKAFEYAHKVGYADWERGAQSLAGRQGLRTSDTPVAQPAMQELRNFELGLGSKRAEMGMNTTLALGQQQNEFDKSFAEFNQNLQLQRTNMRQGFLFGGGLKGMMGTGAIETGSGSGSQQPSLMNSMGQFSGMAGNAMMAWGAGNKGASAPGPGLSGSGGIVNSGSNGGFMGFGGGSMSNNYNNFGA